MTKFDVFFTEKITEYIPLLTPMYSYNDQGKLRWLQKALFWFRI